MRRDRAFACGLAAACSWSGVWLNAGGTLLITIPTGLSVGALVYALATREGRRR